MSQFQPPFTVTSKIIHYISDIAEAIGKLSIMYNEKDILQSKQDAMVKQVKNALLNDNVTLTKAQINTIYHKDDIDLSEEIIKKVNNSIEVYEQMNNWDINLCDDFLTAHKALILSQENTTDNYRTNNTINSKKLKVAPQALHIPQMMEDLFSWLSTSTEHPLIKSSVFHYELKFIHPFVEGNSRIASLWQSKILKQWNPLFILFPVEKFIEATKQQYNSAINESTDTGDSSVFIEYILENTLSTILKIDNSLFLNKEPARSLAPIEKNTTPQETPQVKALINVLRQSDISLNRKQLQEKLKLKDRKHFRERYLKPAMDAALIEMTIPEKPNSKLQKYRLI